MTAGKGNEYHTDYQPEAVCPHCGKQQQDTGEFFLGHGMTDFVEKAMCAFCENYFSIQRYVTTDYSTEKIKP